MLVDAVQPRWFTEDIAALADVARRFVAEQVTPKQERWIADGAVDREVWLRAGALGILLPDIAEQHGGSGGTFAHEAAVAHELCLAGDTSFRPGKQIHVIAAHYIERYGTSAQKQKYLPRMASGECVAAMGMTEPGGGTDLRNMRSRAIRSGGEYIVRGSKTFITNGSIADLIVLAAKTDPTQKGRGVSLLLFETATEGFRVGRRLKKVGLHGSDTCELYFDDCRISAEAVLGGVEGQGFAQMMQDLTYERALVGVNCAAVMERAFAITTEYAKTRNIFDKRLLDLQHSRFELAEIKTTALIARVFVDFIVERMAAGGLDAELAAMAKWWTSDRQCEIVSRCLQVFGGHGYMLDYPIGRMFVDSRIEPIYAGANELMKDLIGRAL